MDHDRRGSGVVLSGRHVSARHTPASRVTRAFLLNGRALEVPSDSVEEWRHEVAGGRTILGLAEWYQLHTDWHTWREHEERPRHLVGESRRSRRWHSVQIAALLCATVFMALVMLSGLAAVVAVALPSSSPLAVYLGGLAVAGLVAAVAELGRRRHTAAERDGSAQTAP